MSPVSPNPVFEEFVNSDVFNDIVRNEEVDIDKLKDWAEGRKMFIATASSLPMEKPAVMIVFPGSLGSQLMIIDPTISNPIMDLYVERGPSAYEWYNAVYGMFRG